MGEGSRKGSTASILDGLPDEDTRRLAAELAMSAVTNESVVEVFERLDGLKLERQISALRATLGQHLPGEDPAGSNPIEQELLRLESQRRRFDDR
jgi:hypothetical protein